MPELMTQTQFAEHIGRRQQYVSLLKRDGRLVMRDGKIDAEASIKRIEATRDPSKQGVADRHEQARQQKRDGIAPPPRKEPPTDYQESRALKEKYRAMAAKRDYEASIGKLLVADEAKSAVADGDAVIRSRLESMPDILASQFAAETDEQKIRAVFYAHIEDMLGEMSRQFHKLASPGK